MSIRGAVKNNFRRWRADEKQSDVTVGGVEGRGAASNCIV
jgi:hypothetical protein